MSLLIYENNKLIVAKDINLKWREVNDASSRTFGEDLKYHQVYVNIHKSFLYQIAYRYPMFPCVAMIYWIVLQTNSEMMVLSSVNGTKISTFRAQHYQNMYHFPKRVITLETPFSIPNNNANSKDILKNYVKGPAKFMMTPNHIYKMKIMQKVYQYLIIFACRLYGQESTEIFPQN